MKTPGGCTVRGPYYPVGRIEWECDEHGLTVVGTTRQDVRCVVTEPDPRPEPTERQMETPITSDPHMNTSAALVALSRWIDAGNADRDPEAVTWGRLAKITEEAGEVIEAFIGATGQNPRKGVTHRTADVVAELLDVAVTALGAVEHMTGHLGVALPLLDKKIEDVAKRAGVGS